MGGVYTGGIDKYNLSARDVVYPLNTVARGLGFIRCNDNFFADDSVQEG